MSKYPYPEHAKLEKITSKSQSIGEFLEWCNTKGMSLHEYPEDHPHAVQTRRSTQDLLAEFFEIDLKKLEKEKKKMIESLRK